MMKLAQIENGVVVNVIEADARPDWAQDWPEAEASAPGWRYANGAFTEPEPEPEPVPRSVSAVQGRAALDGAGMLDAATAAAQAAGGVAAIAWEYATSFDRDNATIAALAAQIGLTDADLDALFIAAAKVRT